MFQRFASKPVNREESYKFCDIRDFNSDSDEDKNSSPEKLILKELHQRSIDSPVGQIGRNKLSPLAHPPVPVISPVHAAHDEEDRAPSSDDFVLDFQLIKSPVAEEKPQEQSNDHHVRFEVFNDAVETPVRVARDSVLVSPDSRFKSDRADAKRSDDKQFAPSSNSLLVSPDMRFKSGRGKKLNPKESRSPLAPLNRNDSDRHRDLAFQVEDVDDEFDTEQLFSRIRHNRIQFVEEAFQSGCNPDLVVRVMHF